VPTYDYRCTECGYVFEEYQSITEDPLEKCPECSGRVERIISGGILITDSRKCGKISSCGTCSTSGPT